MGGTTDTAGDRVQRYLLDGGDDEGFRRLPGISEVRAELARTALRRFEMFPLQADRVALAH
ncbi:MAG TPA: hypothetical protein VHZ03_55025 [Trebonia sp.]|jgi:hypothetical protein|nr:hypothetical protein [Trebonia sp.]